MSGYQAKVKLITCQLILKSFHDAKIQNYL